MKEIQFSIRDIKLYERFRAESGYGAHIKATAGQPDNLVALTIATDEENGIIDEYIQVAINECIVTTSRYLAQCNVSHENDNEANGYKIHNFSLSLPHNYPETHIISLENVMMDFICNRTLQQWYALVKSDDANTVAIKAQSAMALMRDILSIRTKPL